MDKIIIYSCSDNYHWIGEDFCPFCGNPSIKTFEFQDGDCIKGDNLCPAYAYGCTSPEPLSLNK